MSAIFINLSTVGIATYMYRFQNETFTSMFCENKAEPSLQCHGSCALHKAMSTSQSQNEDKKIRVANFSIEYIQSHITFFFQPNTISISTNFPINNSHLPKKPFLGKMTPPPQII